MCNHHYSLVTLALIAFLFLACKEEPYVPVSYLTVIPATVEIMEGEETDLSVWIRPDDATDKTVSWSSRNPSLVQVDPNGHVITLAPGETTIVAQVTDKTAECHITILRSPYNTRITFSDPGVESALVAAFDANGDGWISEGEASDVTTMEGVFGDRKDFRSFDEFRYFTHITRLPDHFFENWSSLQSIVLPGALKEIGERAFAGCSNLLELSLPDGVSRIGDSAFSGCRQLTSFRVPKDIEILPPSMLEGCSGLLSVVLPEKVRWIRERAFAGCSGLKGMDLGYALLRIDCGAFAECTSLVSLHLPASVTEIAEDLFSGCTALTDCPVYVGVKTIGAGAFRNCRALPELFLPESVESIGAEAFLGCSSLSWIRTERRIPAAGADAMFGDTGTCPVEIPVEGWDLYRAEPNWNLYESRFSLILHVASPEPVDLGLSVKWASFNVGATVPEEFGMYFAWGETEEKNDYSWARYRWCRSKNDELFPYELIKYNYDSKWGIVDDLDVLEPADDAAHIKLGGTWRMPTAEEMQELLAHCLFRKMTLNGVKGFKCSSLVKGYEDQWIFFPNAGAANGESYYVDGNYAHYATATLDRGSSTPRYAKVLKYSVSYVYFDSVIRHCGISVRAVCP